MDQKAALTHPAGLVSRCEEEEGDEEEEEEMEKSREAGLAVTVKLVCGES